MSLEPPDGPSGLTNVWLEAALRHAGHPDVSISDVAVEEVGTGQTGSSYRVRVTYDEESDLPSAFVAKLAAEDPSVRERVAYGYRAEVAFYETVAPTVQVPLPTCYVSAISSDAERFVLLLQDLFPARQGDQLRGCTPTQARAAVVALAGLHGPRWCDPSWRDFRATAMPFADAEQARSLGGIARIAADMFLERLGERLRSEDRLTLNAFPEFVTSWLLAKPERFSLLHGDYRLDNLMFAPDDTSVTVLDWQTLSVGLPTRDLSYFISTSLPADVRPEHEHALVADYHEALVGFGVDDYGLDECFADYRLGLLQAPLISTLGAAFSTTTARGDDMMLVMLHRACVALRDLGTYEMIDGEVA